MITLNEGLRLNLPDITATQELASSLAKKLAPGLCIYLHGDLGAGKTTFVRALLTSLGVTGAIKSPTYTLVESYDLNDTQIYHFDLYRIADPSELEYIGIRDYALANAVCIFEWADKGLGMIPAADIEITLQFTEPGRNVVLLADTTLGLEVLQAMTIG